MTTYLVPAGTAAKVARSGETPRAHTVTDDQHFTADDLVASPEHPGDHAAAARWARRGWCVFQRGEWYLIVRSYDAQIAF